MREKPSIARSGEWWDYVTGVCDAFAAGSGPLPQIEAVVTSDVPVGSGLSSSAALEMATAVSLTALAGESRPREDLALLCWRVENEFVGQFDRLAHTARVALCYRAYKSVSN